MMRRPIVLALALTSAITAAPPIDRMKSQAFMILVEHTVDGKKSGGIGSGFPIDPTHVVTNRHVCCNAPQGASTNVVVAVSGKEMIKVTNVHVLGDKDLAVLVLETAVKVEVPLLSLREYLKEGQDVWAVGFPGASRNIGDEAAAFVPSISKGIVSKFLSAPPEVKDGAPVGHIQVTAAINGGNSGGPLFDECGRVAGIVVAKALTKLGTSKAFAEGVNLAIMVDELVPELEKAKLTYTVGTGACEAGSGSSVSMIQIATLFAAGASLFVALNKRAREALGRTTRKLTHRPEPPVLPAPPGRMVLVGVAGPFVGQRIPLSAKPCVLGRDASVSNLVFPHGSEQVSKRHCQVSCDKAGRILLEDSWSSNGTFAASGQRIAAGQPRELRPGDRFYVGSANNMFEVTAE